MFFNDTSLRTLYKINVPLSHRKRVAHKELRCVVYLLKSRFYLKHNLVSISELSVVSKIATEEVGVPQS